MGGWYQGVGVMASKVLCGREQKPLDGSGLDIEGRGLVRGWSGEGLEC